MLTQLVTHFEQVTSTGAQVFGVSLATPYANRQAEERFGQEFPFPLLSDFDANSPLPAPNHQRWHRWDGDRGQPLTGLFLVDRSGRVTTHHGTLAPIDDTKAVLDQLTQGIWPANY